MHDINSGRCEEDGYDNDNNDDDNVDEEKKMTE